MRYHQSDVRKIQQRDYTINETITFKPPINKERFTTILNNYITNLITGNELNYDVIFSDLKHYKSSTVHGTTTKVDISDKIKDTYLIQYKLIQKQYNKSVFVDMDSDHVIAIITKVIKNITENHYTCFYIQVRIMDFYLLFRLF